MADGASLIRLSASGVLTLVPATITALRAKWAAYPSSMTTSDKLAALNSLSVPGPARDVQRSEIKKVLQGGGVFDRMQAYVANPAAATQPCLTATNYILALVTYEASLNPVLATSIPANLAAIQVLVPNLLADPANGMTPATLTAVMALITPGVPWWQANGFSGPILVSDLIAAGNLF
jgi:hypothetical protein